MSYFGKYWKIGGLIAGPISGGGVGLNGSYSILFERANGATLEGIEAIDWASPAVRRLPACPANEAASRRATALSWRASSITTAPGILR